MWQCDTGIGGSGDIDGIADIGGMSSVALVSPDLSWSWIW